MVYYTGDIHGNAKAIVAFAQYFELTESDTIVILGDVGANYYGNRRDRYCKDALARIKPTVFCIHGNHERRPDTLTGYKQKEWNSGLVWYEDEYPNLLFARDGDIFTMEGTRHLVIGGAYSVDKYYRLENDLLWFADEQPSAEIKTYDASPTPPTWDTFANSLLCLDRRLEMWKLMQESWLHHKAVEAQKGVSKMSTSYFIFTEVLANDQWHCINPQVMKLLPIEHLILVPTLRSDSRYQFEKAYRQLEYDGHPFTVDEMSRNLQASVNDWLTPEDSVRIAVCYDDILKLLNTSGKEHSAFALRSEVAAFQNDESDSILDFVSVDEYRKMEDELKKAYQYFEWNDRSGAYRYYEEIQKKVAAQVKDWKAINPRAEITSVRIMLFST